MAGLWQRTGNVTVTNGSKTITGFGTKWKTGTLPIQKGHAFYGPDNAAYEVDTVVSDTEIILVDTYRGGTLANQPYRIDITRTSTISQFAADLASLVAKYRSWFDGMMTWLTGSGDVAILNPDTGANITIPSWKKVASEGEGQTARAKTEADKAAASAALAGDIVAASALPLPDVWAPLTDSLRLFTGYGREVKVGEDVVARMVNFSRNSAASTVNKTGALDAYLANEPRFTLKGLLGEPSSSNYITTSEGLSQMGTEAGSSVVTESGVTLVSYSGTGSLSKDCVAPASSALTLSFYVRIGSVGTTINVQMRDGPTVGFTASISVSAAGVLSVSNSDNILSSWGLETVSPSLVRAYAVIKPSTATTYRLYRGNPAIGETFGSFQLEPMPFATSYIKTSGAVTTRVADSAFLPSSGNRFYKPFFSVAFSWSFIGIRSDITDNRLIDFDNDTSSNRHYVGVSQSGRLVAQFGVNRIISPTPVSGGVSVLVVNGATFSLYHDGVKIGESTVTGWSGSPNGKITLLSNSNELFKSAGSMRDLKMWMRALTDAQAKGVK
ncbi:phage head spike fiber domain-containing protein [Aeromonas media]|uniref:phage head spike fiber domain-containing protein n=1 Tax=Aeromonas media TaxID=651 RepID=UPI0002787C19|nr:hypothetical protein [Aeromonas media]AHX60530.1 lambdoid prophage side tail fiber protein-like protein [Aeromonas media WS]